MDVLKNALPSPLVSTLPNATGRATLKIVACSVQIDCNVLLQHQTAQQNLSKIDPLELVPNVSTTQRDTNASSSSE